MKILKDLLFSYVLSLLVFNPASFVPGISANLQKHNNFECSLIFISESDALQVTSGI